MKFKNCLCGNELIIGEFGVSFCNKCRSLYIKSEIAFELTGISDFLKIKKANVISIERKRCECGELFKIVNILNTKFIVCVNCNIFILLAENIVSVGDHIFRGNLFSEIGMLDNALADLNLSIELKENSVSYFNRGLIYFKYKDFKKAILDYEMSLKLNPNNIRAMYNLGVSYEKNGNLKKAINIFSKAIENSSNYADCYFSRGICYEKLNNITKASDDFSRCILLDRNNAEALLHRGYLNYALGYIEAAIIDFKNIVISNPNCGIAWQFLGQLYLTKNRSFSLDCLEKALVLRNTLPDKGQKILVILEKHFSVYKQA